MGPGTRTGPRPSWICWSCRHGVSAAHPSSLTCGCPLESRPDAPRPLGAHLPQEARQPPAAAPGPPIGRLRGVHPQVTGETGLRQPRSARAEAETQARWWVSPSLLSLPSFSPTVPLAGLLGFPSLIPFTARLSSRTDGPGPGFVDLKVQSRQLSAARPGRPRREPRVAEVAPLARVPCVQPGLEIWTPGAALADG